MIVKARERPAIQPPILEQIVRDLAHDWRDTPRWLGNIEHLVRAGKSIEA